MRTPDSRRSVLDDVGDQWAEPGSAPWAKWFLGQAKLRRTALDRDVTDLQALIEDLTKYAAWKALGFRSLDAMCRKELALEPADVEAIRTAKPGTTTRAALGQKLAADETVTPAGKHGGNRSEGKVAPAGQGDNVPLKSHRGNSAEALVKRLKRDAPAVAADLAAGKYPSARAAGIAAGIVRVPTPHEAAVKAVRSAAAKLTAAGRRKLLKELTEVLDG